MLDLYGRIIDTIRVSLTDQCNLNCFYCKTENICSNKKQDNLDSETIINIIKMAADIGIKRIKLTGGEPLLRKDIVKLIRNIASLKGVEDLSMTTNGVLLPLLAGKLAEAGLNRVNISLDSLDPATYRSITGGDLEKALEGIDSALEAGLVPIKINTVFIHSGTAAKEFRNDIEIKRIKEFCRKKGLSHQLINLMDLGKNKLGQERPETGLENFCETDKPPACSRCSRIRLTGDGKLLPCLFSTDEIDINQFQSYHEALVECINKKPQSGYLNNKRNMCRIGG